MIASNYTRTKHVNIAIALHIETGKVRGSITLLTFSCPFRHAKIKFAGIVPRTGYLKLSHVEMTVQTFAILEYMRLSKQIHYWYTSVGIGAGSDTLEDDLPEIKDLEEGENWL